MRYTSWAIIGKLAGDDQRIDATKLENNVEMNREAVERALPLMAKVYNFLGMWQGSQNLFVTQKNSSADNKWMTAVRYFSDTEDMDKVSWSNFQQGGAAALKLLEQ